MLPHPVRRPGRRFPAGSRMVGPMPTPEQVKGAAEAYIAASNANDKQDVLSRFAADAVWFDPVGRPPHVGIDGIGAFFDQTRAMADRIEMRLLDVIVCGPEAAMVLEIQVTIGDSEMVMDCVETLEVNDDGRISAMKAYWDMSRARTRGA
jgi:steroid Delta-isomerase